MTEEDKYYKELHERVEKLNHPIMVKRIKKYLDMEWDKIPNEFKFFYKIILNYVMMKEMLEEK